MELIDSHVHIYLPEFDEDREAAVSRAREAGIEQMLLPAIDSGTHDAMLKTEATFAGCRAMMGLHPCSVKETVKEELNLVETYLKTRRFVAVGEIGLDFYWDKTYTAQQYEAFHYQINLALQYHLPIAIHSRSATPECIKVVQQYPGLTGVFHCFSGNLEEALEVMDTGFFLGIGGVATFKNAGLDKIIERIGLSQVILETDAPYLAPAPYRGKRNEPAYTRQVAEKLSQACDLPLEEVAKITTGNSKRLFRL
jgi:TatD DNase family protein